VTAEQGAWACRLMTVRPWVLFGILIVAPVAAIVAAFLTPVAQSPRWMMLGFGFVGAAQWTAFLSWEWVVATRMVAIVGELGLTRFRRHLMKGGYDVSHEGRRGPEGPPGTPGIHD
jgi:hypothetical protein